MDKIIPLSEGIFTIDQTKIFQPFEEGKDDLQARPKGSLLVEIQPFAVITSNDILLFDTGLGFSQNRQLQIYSNLSKAGIQSTDITKVLLSHLHKDHAGGIEVKDKLGHPQLAFPNATYYLQEKELQAALEADSPSYLKDELGILEDNPKVVYLNGDGFIDEYIEYKITGGHSPFHQVFWIRENEDTIFFGGDVAPSITQMKFKYIAKYDFDGKEAMELRKKWWETGEKEGWTFLFYHDVKIPVFSFKNGNSNQLNSGNS